MDIFYADRLRSMVNTTVAATLSHFLHPAFKNKRQYHTLRSPALELGFPFTLSACLGFRMGAVLDEKGWIVGADRRADRRGTKSGDQVWGPSLGTKPGAHAFFIDFY